MICYSTKTTLESIDFKCYPRSLVSMQVFVVFQILILGLNVFLGDIYVKKKRGNSRRSLKEKYWRLDNCYQYHSAFSCIFVIQQLPFYSAVV